MDLESLAQCLTDMARGDATAENRLAEMALRWGMRAAEEKLRGRNDQCAEDREDAVQLIAVQAVDYARAFVDWHRPILLSSDDQLVQAAARGFQRILYTIRKWRFTDILRIRVRRPKIVQLPVDLPAPESRRLLRHAKILILDEFDAEIRRAASAYSEPEKAIKRALLSGLRSSQRQDIRNYPAVKALGLRKAEVEKLIPAVSEKTQEEKIVRCAKQIYLHTWENSAVSDSELRDKPLLKDLSSRLFRVAKRRCERILDRVMRG